MFYVYILEDKNKRKYIGFSSKLRQRLAQHQRGEVFTTRDYVNPQIIYFEAYRNKCDAQGRERFLKSGAGWRFIKKQLVHYFKES